MDLTKENIKRLYAHYKNMEANGNSLYKSALQGAIKSRGKLNRIELEAARPWLLEEKAEKETKSNKKK